MKLYYFTFIILISNCIMACTTHNDDQQERIETVHISSISEEETTEPPPPGLVSKFNTVEEWLTNICHSDTPKKSIATYNFGLFEATGHHTLYLVGTNEYEIGENHSATRIEFQPTNMYFLLPTEYQKLERQQIIDRLTVQLKAFTNTDEFKRSFLAKAQSISTGFGGVIWAK